MVVTKAEAQADLVLLTRRGRRSGDRDSRTRAGSIARIVEATDAAPEELAIRERNTGVYLLSAELLWKMLAQVGDRNEQGEIYLTDLVGAIGARRTAGRSAADGGSRRSHRPSIRGSNSRGPPQWFAVESWIS